LTLYGEPRVWLEEFPLEQPVPLTYDHLGLRYYGEIIRGDGWSPAWGEPLTGDIFFRIVLLRQRRAPRRPTILDSRIALCLPGAGLSRRRNRLAGELSTIRETQAVYLSHRDTEAGLIRTTLERREAGLEEEFMGEESVRYSEGEIFIDSGQPPDPASFFAGLDPLTWYSRLAGWLLTRAYPTLPIDGAILPRPVTADDPAHLHSAIFAQPGSSPGILAELGPGLGLNLSGAPEYLDMSNCPVAGLIRSRLASLPAPAPWVDLHHFLAHQIGLTGPLATLYTLLYLFAEEPELELRLSPDHQLALVEGRRLLGTRLTSDLIPPLLWDRRIAGWGTTIGPATELQWNDTLLYLSALSPDLTTVDEKDDFRSQEGLLLGRVRALGQDLTQATGFLELLARTAADPDMIGAADYAAPFRRLLAISGDDFVSVYQSVRRVYRDYRQLEADLATLRQLVHLGQWQEDILRGQEYLQQAAVPPSMAELSIQRQGLHEALAPGPLLRSSRGWEGLVPQISRFKSEYASAYRSHHQRLHQSLPSYQQELESAHRKMRAHTLLNTLPELGEPTGAGLSDAVENFDGGPDACLVGAADLDLQSVPWCQSCRLPLEQSLPTEELARLLSAIDGVLGEKNRRLSNLLVERILQGNTDKRLEEFLNIVQASDLSALSNTLSEELLEFIRRLLS